MDNETPKPYEKRNINYVYIPYWIIKLEQIIDEVKDKRIQKYDKDKYIKR